MHLIASFCLWGQLRDLCLHTDMLGLLPNHWDTVEKLFITLWVQVNSALRVCRNPCFAARHAGAPIYPDKRLTNNALQLTAITLEMERRGQDRAVNSLTLLRSSPSIKSVQGIMDEIHRASMCTMRERKTESEYKMRKGRRRHERTRWGWSGGESGNQD